MTIPQDARIETVARELYVMRRVTKLADVDPDDGDREQARRKWDGEAFAVVPERVRAEMRAAAVVLLDRLDALAG